MSAAMTLADAFLGGAIGYRAGRTRGALFRANADIAGMQARSEMDAGAYAENIARMHGAALEGQQVAQIGANNLQQAGSPAQVVADSARLSEINALETRNNALRRAWGFEVQSESDRFQAKQAERGGVMDLAGSILSGGVKAFDEYGQAGGWFK